MSITESARAATSRPSPHLAWPSSGKGDGHLGSPAETATDSDLLRQIGTKLRFNRNETIFHEGDPAEYAYKLVSGSVRLCKHMADGRRQIAQFLFPGDYFSFLELEQHSFTAEAVSDVVVTCYPQRQLEALSKETPALRKKFLAMLSQRVLDLQEHLVTLGRQTAKERVASFLVLLSHRVGCEDDNMVDVQMSRQDIADYLGLRIETVCRVLSDLKRAGMVDIPNQHQLILKDVEGLSELADSVE